MPEIGVLTNLTSLNIGNNKLIALPTSIGLLAKLKILHINNNAIRQLPITLGNCSKLSQIHLSQNAFVSIPPEILSALHHDPMQADILLGYLHNLQKGSKRFYNMKMMFVGNGNVGKTMLMRALTEQAPSTLMQRMTGNGLLNSQGPNVSTDGIDISNWVVGGALTQDLLPTADDRLVFSCWDFAGQEVYYTTHQFFLSQRSLYVVIFDMRHPDEELSRIEYWMQSIMSRTSHAPVVVVGTHSANPVCTRQYIDKIMDEVEKRINRVKCADLVKTFAVVDSVQGGGIDSLRLKLISLALEQPYMGEEVPQNYTALQYKINAIKQTGKTSLAWDEYQTTAVDCGISEGDVVGVTKYLHNLGAIVHFADEQLKNLVVVNPQFLVDIMATIFSTKNAFVKGGVLNHADLPHIWREPRFPASLYEFMLSLLQRFEVCFSFPGYTAETGSSLFPSLLPKERPATEFVWPEDINWLSGGKDRVQHDRIFQLEFFPSGLFSRLMVRLLQTTTANKIWRYGIILTNASGETAVVELTHHTVLRMSVRGGPNSSQLFRMLVDTFELLVSKWYNIKSFKRSTPCIHCIADPTFSRDPHYFALEDCERAAAQGSSNILCPKANVLIRLDQLVPDVVLTDLESRKIDFTLVRIEKELAKGGFGIVYKGEYNQQVVAVKKLIIDEGADERNAKAFAVFRREVWVMSGLRHPNVVQLLGFCVNPMAMVMEYVPSGTLYKYLAIDRTQPLDWAMRLKCASDIAHGMLFLHTLNPPLMHRDFKSPNVLMASNIATSPIVCKVGDFGLSSQMWVDSMTEREIANPTWLAPEVIAETEYTVKSDIYSFGLILWELLTRQHPYQEFDCKFTSQLEKLVTSGQRPTMPAECIPEYKKLITDCWQSDAKLRPSFAEISPIIDKMLAQHLVLPCNNGIQKSPSCRSIPESSPVEKPMDATFVKYLRSPRPVWSLCVHNNRVWSSHGVEVVSSPKLLGQTEHTNTSALTSSSTTFHFSKASSPRGSSPASPPISPRTSSTRPSSPTPTSSSPRATSPSNSPRPTPASLAPISPIYARTNSNGRISSSSPTSTSPQSTSPIPARRLGKVSSMPDIDVGDNNTEPLPMDVLSEICIWDTESGNMVGKVEEAHAGIINTLLGVNDDVWSGAEDGSIKCWNIQGWESIQLKDGESETSDFSGFLTKKSLNRFSQIWQKRWFVLKGNVLTRYKFQNSTRPKEVLELKSATAVPNKRKYCIALTVKSTSKGKPEGTAVLIAANTQEEYELWLTKLQTNTLDASALPPTLLKPDLVGETFCGFGAVKCMQVVDGRVWAGSRGCICAWNIEEQRYTGVIKLNKNSENMKGEELEEVFVTSIISHNNFVWCAVGSVIIRVDPKTRQLIECIDGHNAPIDDMILVGNSFWTCSAEDHTLRFWDISLLPRRATRKLGTVFEGNDGVTLSNVDKLLWFGSADGSVRVWDPEAKKLVKTLDKKHTATITSVAMVNNTVWVASADATISVWLVS